MTQLPLSTPTLSLGGWAGPGNRARHAAMAWGPTVAGCALFVLAAIVRSPALTGAATAVTSFGLLWVPVALLMQHRLGAIPRPRLLLGAVLIVQGLHTVEHVVQAIESYRLDYPPARSLGVVSQLNVEWVHFSWNWLAALLVVIPVVMGIRTWASALLVAWITLHSIEHTYLLVRYLAVTSEMQRLGLPGLGSSEVLPGIFGRDGWLALHAAGLRPLLGPFASAPRVGVHLWWNVGEVLLTALACIVPARSSSRSSARR